MKTLKTILLIAISIIAININAQEKKTTFGLKVGLNVSNFGSTDDKEFTDIKSKTGFHAGFTLDHAITDKWYLLTGLEYTVKGTKIDPGAIYNDVNVTAAYIQLPLSAGFKIRPTDQIAILFNLGPYFAYGLHGKIDGGGKKADTFSDSFAKNFDCGITLGAALEWQKLCLKLGGDAGLVNIMQKGYTKAHMNNFALSLGYKF
ncbi:PorT family protein [Dysgonomonas sp. Marseille-P4677]|uniref:porin family protein n=1 Tax=Dysgonomonas sp. Marseille-P4677 TaxID=2364790 RepID=UPI001911BC51|nr:porin family protein [Dysgonomonas sp. Marseille-P4677]MBK5722095.1 PorT family protein [Dysgonomonas sp. Marseille-P4677]